MAANLDSLLSNIDPDQQTAIRAFIQQLLSTSAPVKSPEQAQAEKQAEARDVARTLATVLKPAKPDAYDGAIDADACLNFLGNQAEYFKLVNLDHEHWVPYTVANLRKDARAWWRSSGLYTDTISWTEFENAFTAYHTPSLPPNSVTAARAALDSLEQRKSSVAAYTHQFRRLLRLIPGIDEATVLHMYVKGLEPSTRKEVRLRRPRNLAQAHHDASELHSILYPADLRLHHSSPSSSSDMKIDNLSATPETSLANLSVELNYFRKQLLHEINSGSSPSKNFSGPSNNPSGSNPGRLTPAEKARLMQRGACFRCRQDGHMAGQCTTFNQQPRRQLNNWTVVPVSSIQGQVQGKANDN